MHLPMDFLPRPFRAHLKEGQRFIIIGVSNVIFTYIVYLLANIVAAYTVAFTVSFSFGILFSAYWNSRYSFSTRLTVGRLAVFTFVCLINYFIGLAILKLLVETFDVHEAVAPLLTIAVMVPISFVGTRFALVGSLTQGRRSPSGDSPAGANNEGSGSVNDEIS
jgi:putative flippase GtrA